MYVADCILIPGLILLLIFSKPNSGVRIYICPDLSNYLDFCLQMTPHISRDLQTKEKSMCNVVDP